MSDEIKEKVPVFRSWNLWYAFVILFLVVLIILFTFFTNYFA
ncbi:MAG: hypothetical protein ABIN89_28535 [Chitinophagaceae bacterium]